MHTYLSNLIITTDKVKTMINTHDVQPSRPLTHKSCFKCFYICFLSFNFFYKENKSEFEAKVI